MIWHLVRQSADDKKKLIKAEVRKLWFFAVCNRHLYELENQIYLGEFGVCDFFKNIIELNNQFK